MNQTFFKKSVLLIVLLFVFGFTNAQLATYPLRSGTLVPANPGAGNAYPSSTGLSNVNITTAKVTVGLDITNQPNGTFNSDGIRVKPNSLPWPTSPNDNFCVLVPLSPKANFDFILNSVTFKNSALDNNPNLWCQLACVINGNSTLIGTPQAVNAANVGTTISISGLNQGFYNGSNYVFKFYFFGNGANDKNQGFRMADLVFNGTTISPPSLNPTVTLGTIGTATKYTNTVTNSKYLITNGGSNYKSVAKSGVLVSTTFPTFSNSIITNDIGVNGITTASYNSSITGLTPNTIYVIRAYIITQAYDTIYSALDSYTTAPYTLPSLSTNAPSNVLSTKVNSGGNNIDSGGYPILQKGVCWALTNNPTVTGALFTTDGLGNTNFFSQIKNLQPSTKYYIKAYARNQLGFGYGNLDSFTTNAPVPTISVSPSNLDFGDLTFGTSPTILSYKINATNLTTSTGLITITPQNGYAVSTTFNGTFTPNATININYTNFGITNKIIYVKSFTNVYGSNSGIITHGGGGVVVPNADTVFLKTNVVQNQDTLSNMGSDFWCGFGYQEKMKDNTTQFDTLSGSNNSNGAHLSLFIAAGNQGDSVIVELPGIPNAPTFPRKVFVPANGFVEVGGFPVGDGAAKNPTSGPDTRLYYTGVSKRGIHIYSKTGTPVAAWLYDWNVGDAAAGTMLFPSNSWNSSYVVQSVGGKANNTNYNNNSFFFVIAKDDNTQITFKPTNDILDSNALTLFSNKHLHTNAYVKYKKDSTYTLNLNKGEVFNAMGFIGDPAPASADPGALDLSGTVISTSCDKKIAVFGGNGRCLLGTAGSNPTTGNSNCNAPSSGSDNLIQQMFPKVAWGTKYLTVPTKNMANNLFRVYVQDLATKVWLNKTLLNSANLINGLYYQFDANKPCMIESNVPISVTQYITSGGCSNPTYGNIGDGDPEMITLSPVQQSIKTTTVYSAIFKNGNSVPSEGASYINVVVKGIAGVTSFKLDGLQNNADTGTNTFTGTKYAKAPSLISMTNAFKKHPEDTSYYYASFWVTSKAKHTLSSSNGFNAIAYGVSKGESYGYNAGTTINNLSAIKISQNPYGTDTSSSTVKTCKLNPVTLQIALPYDTSTVNSIIWDAGSDATKYTPTGPIAGDINPSTSKPQTIGTIVRDGRTFFIYKSPQIYQFFEEGAFKVKVTVNGTFVNDCGGVEVQNLNVFVGHDDISFTAIPAGCGSTKVTISDATTPLAGTTINKWIWDFGDNTKDSAKVGDAWAPNPQTNPHSYASNAAYTIKLTTINSVGCFSYDSVSVDLAFGLTSNFVMNKDTACPNESVVFSATSSNNVVKWFWDFGDGSNIDSTSSISGVTSHSFTPGDKSYVIKHWGKTIAGCSSAIYQDTIFITHQPVANFVKPNGFCYPGITAFVNKSDTDFVNAGMPYTYKWDFGVTTTLDDTSMLKDPKYQYSSLPGPSGFTISLFAKNRFGCVSNVKQEILTAIYSKPVAVIKSTSDKKVCVSNAANFYDSSYCSSNQALASGYWDYGNNINATVLAPNLFSGYNYTTAKTYTIKHVVTSDKGCVSDTAYWTVKVNPKPIAGTILPSSCITLGSLFFQDNSTVPVDDSVQTPYTYTWNFGDAVTTFTNKDENHTYATTGTYIITHTITTANGCVDIKQDSFEMAGSKPTPKFYLVNSLALCSNLPVELVDTSRVAIGTLKKIEIRWDVYNNYNQVEVDNSPQNGAVGSSKTYIHKYPTLPNSKNYTIRIYAYSGINCVDSFEKTSQPVYGSPKVLFNDIPGVCINGGVKKINIAKDSSTIWNNPARTKFFYSSNSSGFYNDSMFNPAIAGVGTHQIKALFVTKIPFIGCRDSAIATIQVWDLPTVKFDTSKINCEKGLVQFMDKSIPYTGSGNINSWSWKFGDPTSGALDSSNAKDTVHYYATTGTYNISLKVSTDSGCVNTLSPLGTVTINPKPKADFLMPNGVCFGTPSIFVDKTIIADNSNGSFTHFWSFGDPLSGALNFATGNPLPNPPHTFSSGAKDSVRMKVISGKGCIDSIAKVVGQNVLPAKPSIIINNVLYDSSKVFKTCLNTPIKFSSNNTANNYTWSFGDSAGIIYNTKDVTHTYPSATNFNGTISLVDSNGCVTAPYKFKIEIWDLPEAKFSFDNIRCERDSVHFIDQSIPKSSSVKKWQWNFGDVTSGVNNSSALQSPAHKYTTANTYNVSLNVTDSNGCVSLPITPVAVSVNPKPKVGFIMPNGVCLNTPVIFIDTTKISDNSNGSFTHKWTFGDPTDANNFATGKPLPRAPHTYSTGAKDSVRLIVVTDKGCIDSAVLKVTPPFIPIIPTYKINGILYDSTQTFKACLNTPITFLSNNTANSYTWTFGDSIGVTYSTKTVKHTYPNATTYVGNIKLVDSNGCTTAPHKFNIEILALPIAAIDFDKVRCEKDSVHFIDKSTKGNSTIKQWLWNFGDVASGINNTSTLQNPAHLYNLVNNYNVNLSVTDSNGCKSLPITPVVVNVNPKPNVNFYIQDTICVPYSVNFKDLSSIADGSEAQFTHTWDFGDVGSPSNSATGKPLVKTSHIYPIANNYNITLKIVSKDGCKNELPKQLKASNFKPQPVALYTVDKQSHDTPRVCLGVPITFKNASLNVKESNWNFGEGTTTMLLNPPPQYTFASAGSYLGSYTITDNFGCKSLPAQFLTIIDPLPKVKGNTINTRPLKPVALIPEYVDVTNYKWTLLKPKNSNALNYLDFDDVENPICTTADSLIFKIKVTNLGGCSDSANYYVMLLQDPEIPSAFSPNGDGINDLWEIKNLKPYPYVRVKIFDRFGQIVYNRFSYTNPWNGKLNNSGAALPSGVYYYIVDPGSGLPTMSGFVTLLR